MKSLRVHGFGCTFQRGWKALLLGSAAAWICSAPANAQLMQDPLPENLPVDTNGVNLATGSASIAASDLSIGASSSGGLSFGRVWTGSNWRPLQFGTVSQLPVPPAPSLDRYQFTVSLGSTSETFIATGPLTASPTFAPKSGNGTKLAWYADGQYFKYVDRDGTQITFAAPATLYNSTTSIATAFGLGFMPGSTPLAVMTEVRTPNGVRTYFAYSTTNLGADKLARLQSIVSSTGYQIHLDYETNGTIAASQANSWRRIVAATAFDVNIDACGQYAASCAFSQNWPRADYTWVSDRLQSVRQQGGLTTAYGYDSAGRLSSVTPPGVSPTTFTYDADGKVSSVTSSYGTLSYRREFDGSSSTGITVTHSNAGLQRTTYVGAAGRVISEIVYLGAGQSLVTAYEYDDVGRLNSVVYPGGTSLSLSYDARGNVIRSGRKNRDGSVERVSSAVYPSTCTNDVTCNQPLQVTDARGKTTNFDYDPLHGGATRITMPADTNGVRPEVRIEYQNVAGAWLPSKTRSCVSGAGTGCLNTDNELVEETSFDSKLQPTSVTRRLGNSNVVQTQTIAYEITGDVRSIDGALPGSGDTTRFYYDANWRAIGAVGPDPDGSNGARLFSASRIYYNASTGLPERTVSGAVGGQFDGVLENVAALTDQRTVYDIWGRPVRGETYDVNSGQRVAAVEQSYDAAGRVECTALRMSPNALGPACSLLTPESAANGADRITRTVYDGGGRPSQVFSAWGTTLSQATQTLTYNASNGKLEQITDPEGNTTRYLYDEFERLSKIEYPNAATGAPNTGDFEQFGYDANDNITSQRRRSGETFTFVYDDLNRVIRRTAAANTPQEDYWYDNFGTRRGVNRNGQTYAWNYDALGRLRSETGPNGSMWYDVDLGDRVVRRTWPDGFFVVYDYDVTGALTSVRENDAYSGPGVLASYSYDNLGRRTQLTRGNGVVTRWSYDGASRLTSLTHDYPTAQDVTQALAYNAAGQIISEATTPSFYEDPVAAPPATYADNRLNQYTNVGGEGMGHNANGATTSRGGRLYTYDEDNRLLSANGAGGATLSYDPFGQLSQISLGGAATRFLYSGGQLVGEYNASGGLVRRHIPGASFDETLASLDGAGRTYILPDVRGTPMALVYPNGAVDVERYDAFGIEAPDNVGRFGFTGQMRFPELGLAYFKNRFYDPALGRFLSPDPLGMVDGPNLYAYVLNDPINNIDPWGLECDVVTGSRIPRCGEALVAALESVGHFGGSASSHGGGGGGGSGGGGGGGSGGGRRGASENCDPTTGGYVCVTVSRPRRSAAIHTFLDFAGYIPGFGTGADLLNAGLYAAEGEYGLAALSAAAAVPLIGDAAASGKIVARVIRACGCFVSGTLVATPEGLVPIETISVGDLVLAYDEATGRVEAKPVTDLIRPEPKETFLLAMTDAQGEREELEATADHPWLVLTSDGVKRWVETAALAPGDRLLAGDGETLALNAKTLQPELVQTYNLTVAGHHTFLVGEDGVVVHNGQCEKAASQIWRQLKNWRQGLRRDVDGKIYSWDNLHKEIEVFDARGNHLGAMDPETGAMIKPPVPGRTVPK